FFNALPAYRPGVQVALLDVWFGVTILYLTTGALMLALAWLQSGNPQERRRLGALCFAVLVFGVVVVQNLLERNWLKWFGTSPPIFLSRRPVSLRFFSFFLSVRLHWRITFSPKTGGRRRQATNRHQCRIPWTFSSPSRANTWRVRPRMASTPCSSTR